MKKLSNRSFIPRIGIVLLLVISSCFLFSFSTSKLADDFLQQLGITKVSADEKISNSILGGYLDYYGARNAKNIVTGDRAAVTRDLLAYTKDYVNSTAFQKAYTQLRDNNKPKPASIETPEAMRSNLIAQYQKSVTETETNMKKADPSMKKIFEPTLVTLKQELKNAQDPNNAMIDNYRKSYPEMVKATDAGNQEQLAEWEQKYPANKMLFVKERLQQFLDETNNIDFAAQLVERNGKKYFVNQAYERKSNRWKMAFRAGKEVVEPAREFVQKWMNEIK